MPEQKTTDIRSKTFEQRNEEQSTTNLERFLAMKTNPHPHLEQFNRAPAGALLLILLLFTSAAPTFAANPPERMSFQGYLTDDNGNSLTSAEEIKTFDVAFRIYSASSGGDLLWAEQQAVSVVGGSFSVLLGEGSSGTGTALSEVSTEYSSLSAMFANTDADHTEFYVGITVGAASDGTPAALNFADHDEITPRLQLATTPFDFVAGQAVTLGQGGTDAITYDPAIGDVTINKDVNLGAMSASGAVELNGGDTRIKQPLYVYATASDLSTYHLFLDENQIQAQGVGGVGDYSRTLNINTLGGGVNLSKEGDLVTVSSDLVVNENTKLTGNVGIGTDAAAGAALTVSGSSSLNGSLDATGNTAVGGTLAVTGKTTLNNGLQLAGTTSDVTKTGYTLRIGANNSAALHLDQNEIQAVSSASGVSALILQNEGGNVGIGTSSPEAKLEISGGSSKYYHRDYTLIGSGTGNRADTQTYPDVCIYASDAIVAERFDAKSDARIKDVIARVNSSDALGQVMRLQLTDYRMKDWIAHGKQIRRGLIAQEVEQILPGAVSRNRRFVPDIYAPAKGFVHDSETKTLHVESAEDHGLLVGDIVRVIVDDRSEEREVVALNGPRRFSLGDWSAPAKELFLYGSKVDDFRTVDYDRVFSTGIAAIQEINRKLEASNQELRSSLASVTEENVRLSETLASVMDRLQALESLVK